MRLHLVTLLFALAGGAFGGSNKPATQTYTPKPTYNNSNTYRTPANQNTYQNKPYVAQPRNVQPRPYVTPGSRSTTGVQPRNVQPRPYVTPGSRSTTGVQPRGIVPNRSPVGRTLSTGPKAQTTISSQRSQLANSSTNKSNVVHFPSATQKQNVSNRLARLQTGSAANQNTPKPANKNTKLDAQARLGKLSDHFNEKSAGGSGATDGPPGGKGGGSGDDGKPPRQPVSLVKNKDKPNLNDLRQKTHEPVQIRTPVGTGVSQSRVTVAAQHDKENQMKRSVSMNKAFTDAHNNTQKTADDNSNAKPEPHPAGGKPEHGPER